MAILTSGRTIPCNDSIGGIRKIFLFPFIDYDYSLIVGTRGVELTDFPDTDIYEFEVVSANFSESIRNEDDGLSYKQDLSFNLKKQDKNTQRDLVTMSKIDFRYIIQFNTGEYKIGGLYGGSTLEFDTDSGGEKSSLNGYNIRIKGEEEIPSAYIADLEDVGFFISEVLLLEDYDDLLQEDEYQIILE